MKRFYTSLWIAVFGLAMSLQPLSAELSRGQLEKVGKRIWKNECAGTVEGLTSWNKGEQFASLGIGHFIWYPKGQNGPFEESFPSLIAFFKANRVPMPEWLLDTADCPWNSRTEFLKQAQSAKQVQLRELLSRTVVLQTQFIIQRLERSYPTLQKHAGKRGKEVSHKIALLKQSSAGNFALIDYVNFKGEGTNPKERYQGQGWGLLQVLLEMEPCDAASAPKSFAKASQRVLARRVQLSPKERGEQRWLAGWSNRCATYAY